VHLKIEEVRKFIQTIKSK